MRVVAWLVLIAAGGWFVLRGPMKSGVRLFDFADAYEASRAWVQGRDPFDEKALAASWAAHGGSEEVRKVLTYTPSVLPPTTSVIMTPMVLLPPRWACAAWMACSVAMIGVWIGIVLSLSGLSLREPRGTLLAAWILAMGTVHILISSGQLTTLAVTCILAAIWFGQKRKGADAVVGLLLGLAMAIKPQLAIVFVVYELYRGRGKSAAIALGVVALVWIVAVARLQISGVDWMSSWKRSLAWAMIDRPNDYTPANPLRSHLINLQLLTYSFAHSRLAANLLAAAIVGVLVIACIRVAPPGRRGGDELLSLATVGALCLMPVYHRYYDSTVLVLALGWAFANLTSERKRYAWAILMLMAVFFLPVGFADNLVSKGHVAKATAATWWWEHLVLSYQVWAVLLMCVCMIAALARIRTVNAKSRSPVCRA